MFSKKKFKKSNQVAEGNYTEINSNQFYLLPIIIKGDQNLMYLLTTHPYNPPMIQQKFGQ